MPKVTPKMAKEKLKAEAAHKREAAAAPTPSPRSQEAPERPGGDDDIRARLALRRMRAAKREEDIPPPPEPITKGPVDKIVDVLVNPSALKMLEVTDFDRNQVVLIPVLAVIDSMWEYCLEVAAYRQDAEVYKKHFHREMPIPENHIKQFVFTLAQCRRSLGGKTQKALEELALADLEARGNEGDVNALGGDGLGD